MKQASQEEIDLPWDDAESETQFTRLLPLYGGVNSKAKFHRPDLWHAIHLGIGKAFLASSMTVIQKGIPGSNVDVRFKQITIHYRQFCKERHLTPYVTKLEGSTFGVGGPLEEPSASWNKASLTSTLSEFLEHLLALYPTEMERLNDDRVKFIEPCMVLFLCMVLILLCKFLDWYVCMFIYVHAAVWSYIWTRMFQSCLAQVSAVHALNQLMRTLYNSDIWLRCPVAKECVTNGFHFVKAYRFLARASFLRKERRFPMMPKMHSVEEIISNMDRQSRMAFWVQNPLVESCSVDEDFIGRTAFISRSVSARKTCLRSLERYLVQMCQVWKLDSNAKL